MKKGLLGRQSPTRVPPVTPSRRKPAAALSTSSPMAAKLQRRPMKSMQVRDPNRATAASNIPGRVSVGNGTSQSTPAG